MDQQLPDASDLQPIVLDLETPGEEDFWCLVLEVGAADPRAAVKQVGPSLPAVSRYLNRQREAGD